MSEVYPTSLKSLRYLLRLGFQARDRVPHALHDMAWNANAEKAVVYMVADPMFYRNLCLKFASVSREGYTFGAAGSVKVMIAKEFGTLSKHVYFAQKAKYANNAFDNLDGIGFGRSISRWLARHFGTPCIDRSEYLMRKGLEVQSWGYQEAELDVLGENFLRTIQGAATS